MNLKDPGFQPGFEIDADRAHVAHDLRTRFLIGKKQRAFATTASGVDEFRPLLTLLFKTFKLGDLMISAMTIDGSQATVHWRTDVRSSITGATVPTELVDLVEIRDGYIVNFNEVFARRANT